MPKININSIASVADQFTSYKYVKRIRESSILWVGDRPNNNIYERMAFEAVGLRIGLAQSTEDALALLQVHVFDAIRSDMERPPDARAGYSLLKQLGAEHPPFIIFSGSDDPLQDQEAKAKGAIGATSSSTFLFAAVMRALAAKAS